jgi:glycosyltransferase involved in cell wall biosynthesis
MSVPLLSDAYVRQRLAGARIDYFGVARSYLTRLASIAAGFRFDTLWIEGELLPRLPATFERLLPRLGRHFVVDLDDAIFHTYDRHPSHLVRRLLGRKIDVIFARASAVIAGNDYLADRARQAGSRRVVLVPTTVDDRAYAAQKSRSSGSFTFGWIGSPATAHYLQTVAAELEELCSSCPATLRLIGVDRHSFKSSNVTVHGWTEATEAEELAACDVGLAPLWDGYWERGKCGLKAIQYMAAGIPVLAADVGALPAIVRHGETGFVYRNGAEFMRYARQLAEDRELRRRMGEAGRRRVAERYSTRYWADAVAEVLRDVNSRYASP